MAVLVSAAWVFLFKGMVMGARRVIELRKNGYYPKSLTIRVGETVTFVSQTGKPFWPASNVHPSHGLYPQFDPLKPVSPDTPWQFTFDRPGKWRFHDHIAPEFTGTIFVLPQGKTTIDALPCQEKNIDLTVKEQCWEDELGDALETKGIKAAFTEFVRLYQTDADFVTTGCHVHAHRIGDKFYETYASGLQTLAGIELPPETMSCGYGFFHGLFEHFFRKHPNIALARSVCEDLDKRYSKTIPLIRINCFHGAGHGLIADPPDPASWGKPQDLVGKPLSLCESISPVESEAYACMDGVFNVVSSWMGDAKYGMSIDMKNPFWLCKTLKSTQQESCYYEQIMVMSEFDNRNMTTITNKYITPIVNKDIANRVMFSLAASLMQKDVVLPDQTHMIRACRSVPGYLQKSCLEGVVNGFKGHGEPGKEYVKMLAFCQNSLLTRVERDTCYLSLIDAIWDLNPQQEALGVCQKIPDQYRAQCEQWEKR